MRARSVRRLLTATALVSAGAIGYELLLMRTLSIVQWHHFAYMIISLALLGYGTSGTALALLRSRLEKHFESVFAVCALLFSITMVASFAVGQRITFNALEVVWDWGQLFELTLMYVVFFVPFFFAACCIGAAFTCRADAIGSIYFLDLLGAGLGAMVTIGAMFVLFPQDALLVLMVLPLVASVLMSARPANRRALAALQLLWIGLFAFGLPQPWLDLRISEYKGLNQALEVVDAGVVAESSSPLGLVTVVDSPTVPIRHAPGLSFRTRHIPPPQLAVYTDADSMTAITRFDGDPETLAFLGDVTAAAPYALLDRPTVLVLGAGGGTDVLQALYHDARIVDAVELNPQVTNLVRDSFANFAGHVYADPRVRVHAAEARGFVAGGDERYDLVHIGLLDSFSASGAGVQSLNESYLYTVEAMREFLSRTAPGGVVAITRWLKVPPRDSLKLFAIATEALRQAGAAKPGSQLAMIRSWDTATLLVGSEPFSGEEVTSLREFADARSFDTAHFPGIRPADANRFNQLPEAWLYEGTQALLGDEADTYLERYKFRIDPATDDRPYFFHFFKWRTLPEVLALREAGGAGLIEWGYLVLVATLVQAILAGLVLILLPLLLTGRNWQTGTATRAGGYFLLLGLAFMFIEMAFIQKFVLFLSHPLYSVAVVLSGFLVFAGAGSACSPWLERRFGHRPGTPINVAVTGIAVLTLLYVIVIEPVFAAFIGNSDGVRILVSILLIAPLAFCLGLPFPLGLRRVATMAPEFIPWAWGINGFASVASAVLAIVLAISFGFTAVLLIAVALYLAAALLFRSWIRLRHASSSTGQPRPA